MKHPFITIQLMFFTFLFVFFGSTILMLRYYTSTWVCVESNGLESTRSPRAQGSARLCPAEPGPVKLRVAGSDAAFKTRILVSFKAGMEINVGSASLIIYYIVLYEYLYIYITMLNVYINI